MKIAFAPPYIDEEVIKEVLTSLQSGWITSGPKVRELELLAAAFCGVKKAVCVNSWSSGMALVFQWLGIGEGDEVIVPAYTYAATPLSVLHCGAKLILVDIKSDFTIDPEKIKAAITPRTKAILSVDIGGWPCDYDAIKNIINSDEVKNAFVPGSAIQKQFGRPVLVSDAAHSLGAVYKDQPIALAPDIAIFSFNAVKNITTAEGGVICLALPEPFDNEEIYGWMKINSLNGQTKDAFSKTQGGDWRYDIVSQGMKINLPDICAAVGLAQLRKYKDLLLPERERVANHYSAFFAKQDWAIVPSFRDADRISSFHLFQLRVKEITEEQRDLLIQKLADAGVATNVHFIPIPMLTLFRQKGFDIKDYPQTYKNYMNEISLPLYPQLTDDQCTFIEQEVVRAYNSIN